MTSPNLPTDVLRSMERHPAGKCRQSVRIPAAVSCHGPKHNQVGHARGEWDTAPGDLADSPAARACLIIILALFTVMAVPLVLVQAWQHPTATTVVAAVVLTAMVWRWAR